jgi:RNA polymerase sigma factor (sigma-70 family)
LAKKKKQTKRQQTLTVEYMPLVRVLASYFSQHRPGWQRAALRDDLEGEGFLALTKAAITYDPKRLPYPKAYFARAILNAMLKWIRKATRTPRENRVPLEVAADSLEYTQELDHLRLAIEALPEDEIEFAIDRFCSGQPLRALAEGHGVPIREASARARSLAQRLAESLGIRLPPTKSGG